MYTTVLAVLMALQTWSLAFNRVASNEELIHEKDGRVVDTHGRPIVGAQVIGVWDVSHLGYNGSSFGCVLQRVTKTDGAGNYLLSDVQKSLDLSERHDATFLSGIFGRGSSSNDFGWRILVFAPNHVTEDDADRLSRSKNPASVAFSWEGGRNPDAEVVNSLVIVEPIVMTDQPLDVAQQIAYYYRFVSVTMQSDTA